MSGTGSFNFNVQNLNGDTFAPQYVAAVDPQLWGATLGTPESVQGGTIYTSYSIPVDANTTGGFLSFFDYNGGSSSDVTSVSIAAYSANAPNIITYTETFASGQQISIGGEVVGESADGNSVLVNVIPNFVGTDPAAGTWTGNLSSPTENQDGHLVFSNIDLSQTETYNDGVTPAPGPNSPLVFGQNSNYTFNLQPTYNTLPPPCFAAGTAILTVRGERRVETLHAGDTVVLATGGTSEIVWIGHRHVDCRHHPMRERVLPICIAPGAFADFQPRRRLLLSPEHCVYIKGVLIPVRLLVNGTSVVQLSVDEITYYHVELAQHAILLSEGLPTESYLDTGNRGIFENCDEPTALHPDFALLAWDGLGCAPLTVTGPEFQYARTTLARRAALGVRVTQPRRAAQRRRVAA